MERLHQSSKPTAHMTYIDAINQMWVANDSYDFTHAEIVIYMVLLDRWNRAGRKYEVGIDYRDVMETAKTCKTTYYQALKKLAKVGLIAYKSGHKSSSLGKLQVLNFNTGNGTETERKRNQDGTETERKRNQDGTETEHYKEELKSTLENKENKSFLSSSSRGDNDDEKKIIDSESSNAPTLSAIGNNSPPVAARPPSVEEVEEYMLELGVFPEQAKKEAAKFWTHNQARGWVTGKVNTPIADFKPVVVRWIAKINEYESKDRNTALPRPEQGGGGYKSLEEIDDFYNRRNAARQQSIP